ncbi:Carboxylesterase 5A [Paramyrothecium foliicola]|nr:Carboxylesterase 5A [Paramyrothecium foliicola]
MIKFDMAATLAIWSLLAMAAATSCNGTREHPVVQIDSGKVAGISATIPPSKIVVNKFLGIPFAERPIRFSPPIPVKPWDTIYDASEYRPSCLQMFAGDAATRAEAIRRFNTPPPPAGEDEDCLNLNVYAPAAAEPGSKPVLFWIHGGNLVFGSGSLPLYDGSRFVAFEDIVVVTINYRTNLFGFVGSLNLPQGQRNVAFLDQRLALDWVRRNIAGFGGDPEQVTIFGQSAGATSIDAIVTAPPNPVPFRAAILQSTQASVRQTPWAGAITAWAELVKAAKCECESELECMRALPAAELLLIAEQKTLVFEPESDGGITFADNLRQNRLDSKQQPDLIAKVPILIGINADEGRFEEFKGLDLETGIRTFIGPVSDETMEQLREAYAIGTTGIDDDFDQITTLVSDILAHCPAAVYINDTLSVGIKTWRYLYDASFANSEIFPGSGPNHAAELDIVFGTYKEEGATDWQKAVSKVMMKAWAAFARNPHSGPGWSQAPEVGVFGGGVRAGEERPAGKIFTIVDSEGLDARCRLITRLAGITSA